MKAHSVKAWLGIHDGNQTSHVIYRFEDPAPDTFAMVRAVADMSHSHLLDIEELDCDEQGRLRVRTTYTGNQQQWIRLGDVLDAKGGQLLPAEAERAITHLLEASNHAHKQGMAHGDLAIERVLVDRHGRVLIELYGFDRAVAGFSGVSAELKRDEIRSIAVIAYTLLTGLAPAEPPIAATHLVSKLPAVWDAWLARGLNPSDGFDTAAEALEALPANQPGEPAPTVRVVRRVLRSLSPNAARRK